MNDRTRVSKEDEQLVALHTLTTDMKQIKSHVKDASSFFARAMQSSERTDRVKRIQGWIAVCLIAVSTACLIMMTYHKWLV